MSSVFDKPLMGSYKNIEQVPDHALPLYATVLQKDYNRLKERLDVCQKECIRIAELYKRDKAAFLEEIDRLVSRIDNDPDYLGVITDITNANQGLSQENDKLKAHINALEMNIADKESYIIKMQGKLRLLEKEVWDLKNIPHTDNSAVIALLLDENNKLLDENKKLKADK